MYLLDTNVVSELRKRHADANVLQWASQVPPGALYLSAITLLELEKGVLLVERRDKRQGKLLRNWLGQQVLSAFEGRILPFDAKATVRCAALHVPDPRSERDAMIAATAFELGMKVVTRNVSDFAGTGVTLINPFAPNLSPAPRLKAGQRPR